MRMRCVVGGSYWSSCIGCVCYELRDSTYGLCIIWYNVWYNATVSREGAPGA